MSAAAEGKEAKKAPAKKSAGRAKVPRFIYSRFFVYIPVNTFIFLLIRFDCHRSSKY